MPEKLDQRSNNLKETIQLSDGRNLGYKEYGAKNGFPIIALHGTPGSRVWFESDDSTSNELGIRLITVDRPGYGLSDKKEKRKIIDFNLDLNQLIAHLKIDRFSIFGVSGGGPYALAYATSNNPKIIKVGLVASAYEFADGKAPNDMCRPNRIAFFLAKYLPWLLRFNYKQQQKLLDRNPEIYISSGQKHLSHLCKSDQEVMKNSDSAASMVLHLQEAYRDSAIEAVNELRLLGRKWELDLSKISASVEVWHGDADTLSPINGLKKFIKNIPNYHTNFLKDKGHFLDEDINIWMAILQSLKP